MHFLFTLLSLIIATNLQARELTDLRTFGDISTSTMYLFTAPSCPHCRDFHRNIFPDLIKKYVKTKRAQIVIVDMPPDVPTLKAVMLMRCLPPEKSEKLMDKLYADQSKWINAKDPSLLLQQYAGGVGMTHSKMQECLQNKDLKDAVLEQKKNLGALYGVRGWPTLALRHGNTVKLYSGTDRRAILYGIQEDMKQFEEEDRQRALKQKK